MKFDDIVKLYESEQTVPYIVIDSDGTKTYYKDSKHTIIHRLDGPACERYNGTKYWYVDDKQHRLDGPAVERANGTKEWWVDNERHRLDGPAYITKFGTEEWYVHGQEMTKEQFNRYITKQAIKKEIQSHENNRIDPDMLEDYL